MVNVQSNSISPRSDRVKPQSTQSSRPYSPVQKTLRKGPCGMRGCN